MFEVRNNLVNEHMVKRLKQKIELIPQPMTDTIRSMLTEQFMQHGKLRKFLKKLTASFAREQSKIWF